MVNYVLVGFFKGEGGVGIFVKDGFHYGGGGFGNADVGSEVGVPFGLFESPFDKVRIVYEVTGAAGGYWGALG